MEKINGNNGKLQMLYVFLFRGTITLHRYLDHAKHANKRRVFQSGTKLSDTQNVADKITA